MRIDFFAISFLAFAISVHDAKKIKNEKFCWDGANRETVSVKDFTSLGRLI